MSRAALARKARFQLQQQASGALAEREQVDILNRKGSVPLTVNSSYNFHNIVWQHLCESHYFRGLYKCSTFSAVVDKIYYDVEHCEPMIRSTRGMTASPCFCLVRKLFLMRLTTQEVQALLTHRDSPMIRAVGLLYLRIGTDTTDLWRWFEPLLLDHEEMHVRDKHAHRPSTVSAFARGLLSSNKFLNTVLPSIPIPVMRRYAKQLAIIDEVAERAAHNREQVTQFRPGMVVDAMYSEDFAWYEARIDERVADGVFLLTYLPEEEYGNQEERSLGYIRMQDERPPGERLGPGSGDAHGGDAAAAEAAQTGDRSRSRSRSRSRERNDGQGNPGGFDEYQRAAASDSIRRYDRRHAPVRESAWQRHRREKKERQARRERAAASSSSLRSCVCHCCVSIIWRARMVLSVVAERASLGLSRSTFSARSIHHADRAALPIWRSPYCPQSAA